MNTLPQPADRTAELEAEVARLHERLCDLGDALARLTAEAGVMKGFLRLLGTGDQDTPGASYTDPKAAKAQACRRRMETLGWRGLVREGDLTP